MQPVVLIAFVKDGCPHCTTIKPILQGLAQAGISIVEQNASRDRQAVQQWRVTGFPACFICRSEPQGLRILGRLDGAQSPDAFMGAVRAAAQDDVGQVQPHLAPPTGNGGGAPGNTQGFPQGVPQTTGRLPMQIPPQHAMPQGGYGSRPYGQ